ncbi:MAG: nuclear transport factor 2 family protein [Frankiales bacterium]|nr:nuclear transport factor 2 family protein [Frankiales bacterium]
MEGWELAAREHIRELIARYNLAGDRGWVDEMMALFAPDAVLCIDGVEHVGLDAIRSVFTTASGPHPELIRHHTATLRIDVASVESACARCYFQVLTVDGLDHWGRYSDRFTCVDGEWRFSHRSVRVDGATPGGWASLRGYTGRGGGRRHVGEGAGRHDVP